MRAAPNGAVQAANSLDQSAFYSFRNNSADPLLFNDTMRNVVGGTGVTQAEKKVIVNQYTDMSRLLNKIDRMSPRINNAGPQRAATTNYLQNY